MKLSDLKPCAVCKGKLLPIWYVLRFSMAMLNAAAANRTMGLAQQFGGLANPGALAIAEAMSPDPDCVLIMGDKDAQLMTEVFICQQCFLLKPLDMAVLMEEQQLKRKTDEVTEEEG